MIVFNEEICLLDEEILELLCQELRNNIYDDGSRVGITELVSFLHECYEADKMLYQITQERIGEDIVPVTFVDFTDYNDLNKIRFSIMSYDKDREFTMREQVIFKEICDICFGNIRGMFDRISAKIDS